MHTEVFGATDIGCVRELNEDSFSIGGFKGDTVPGYCVLADGMGGHNAGEVASQTAVDVISEALSDFLKNSQKEVPMLLDGVIKSANDKIFKAACEDEAKSGMGTTAVIACVFENEMYIANIGDSRAYALRGDEFYQITKDHSMVAEMVTNGTITSEEARVHPQKNVITRALGTDEKAKADIFEYEYQKGDILLMCSDGLSGMVTDDDIKSVLKSGDSAKECTEKLISLAKENGGKDNITVICLKIG